MPISEFRRQKLKKMADIAQEYYEEGYSLREVEDLMQIEHGFKRSHAWYGTKLQTKKEGAEN